MQRLLSLLLFLLFVAPFAQATTTKASDFGYDPSNATAAFRAAIESDFDTIIVDLQAEDWWLEPTVFFGLEDKSIFFERDVVLRALPGAFDDQNANLIRLVGGKNIVLEGYSVSFQMNKAEYDTIAWSEWRHCLALWDCENVSIEGLTFKDSGGDGIFIGGSHEFGVGYCKDIRIKNVLCDNNYRQGMSVISVENLLVQHSRFDRTSGTLPEAGVDIEPDVPADRLVNIRFEDCSFQQNGWAGIALGLHNLDGSSLPVSIVFEDCYLKDNRRPENEYTWCEIFIDSNYEDPVQGAVLFERVLVDDSQWGAFYSRKTAEAFSVTFRDCVFKEVSQSTIEFNEPITLEVPSYEEASPAIGGYTFENLLISYPTAIDFFRVFGAPTLEGVANINGSILVVSPHDPTINYDNQLLTDVDLSFQTSNALPSTIVTFREFDDRYTSGECYEREELLFVNRSGEDFSFPLAVNYAIAGNATNGDDYDYLPLGRIIATDSTQFVDTKTQQIAHQKILKQ